MPRKPTNEDLESFQALLFRLRRALSGDIGRLEDDALGSEGHRVTGDNAADLGSDRYSQDLSLQLLARDEATLGEVEDALSRIEKGTFGRCESCEVWIPKARLKAVPHAKLCVSCQRDVEKGF